MSTLKTNRIENLTTTDGGISIDNSGRVLLGTTTAGTTAADDLTVSTSGDTGITIRSGTSNSGSLMFADGTSGSASYRAGIDYYHSSDHMAFTTNGGNERVRIDSSGRVGIGATSFNDAREMLRVQAPSGEDGTFLTIKSPSTTGTSALFFGDDDFNEGRIEYNHNNNSLNFHTDDTQRVSIDSSGRLLVGTSSARTLTGNHTGQIQLEGTSYQTSTASIVSNSNDSSGAYIFLGKARGGSVGSNTIVQDDDTLGELRFLGSDGVGDFPYGAFLGAYVDGTPGSNDLPTRLGFSTTADGASSPTERMRITAEGIGYHISTNHGYHLGTTAGAGTTKFLYRGHHSSTAGTYNSGTECFTVWSNGNVINTNNSYGQISDVKLKENIADANSQWNDIKAVQVRNFNFKEETGNPTHTQIGVIAQEIETVSPGLVTQTPDLDDDGNDLGTVTKSVNYSVLYMKAVKALQEAMNRIETLEAEVAALKSN